MQTTDMLEEQSSTVRTGESARVSTVAPIGFSGEMVEIECDTSNGLPAMTIVGLGNKAIDEAKERVRSAITNSGLEMPKMRITLNLAPADLPKVGSSYDLPIASAILLASRQIPAKSLNETVVAGELSLNGELRTTKGAISFAQTAIEAGYKRVILPRSCSAQAAFVGGIEVIGVDNLRELYMYLNKKLDIQPEKPDRITSDSSNDDIDISHVSGQAVAKRALEIAAAGSHNILLQGPPGTGKSMLAKSLLSILPPLKKSDIISTTKLHHQVGLRLGSLVVQRPFRAPHHSTSHVALVGGGRLATPGEVSLAHAGVLFLDEIPEFSRQALESLRQPLEDGIVTVSRAEQTAVYPADFMLVATRNPCPCGFLGDEQKACTCSAAAIANYQNKLSGPLLDRIDVITTVDRVDHEKLLSTVRDGDSSSVVAARIVKAQSRQLERQAKLNSQLSVVELKKHHISSEASKILLQASKQLHLSPRSYFRVLRVARTIADLAGDESIGQVHIREALQFRLRG